MMQVTMDLDPQLDKRLLSIEQKLDALLKRKQTPEQADANDWKTASDFCMTYHIGRSTLDKKAKLGEIEVLDGHGRIKRYRWKTAP